MLLAAAAADIRPRDDNGERPPHHVIIQQIYRSHKDVDRYRPPEQLIWGHLIYIADERESTVNERSHKMYTTLDRYEVSKNILLYRQNTRLRHELQVQLFHKI